MTWSFEAPRMANNGPDWFDEGIVASGRSLCGERAGVQFWPVTSYRSAARRLSLPKRSSCHNHALRRPAKTDRQVLHQWHGPGGTFQLAYRGAIEVTYEIHVI